MVRQGFTVASLLFAAACTGEIQSENLEGLSPTEQVARSKWIDKALPIFSVKCVSCHDGSMPNIGYLAGADDLMRRDTLVAYVPRIVNLGAPQSSRVLTKGSHTGPALEAKEASDILSWIVAERDARPPAAPIRSAQLPPMVCMGGAPGTPTCPINTIDLAALGVAATFEFVIETVSADSYFTNLKIKAGAEGVYLEHPLLESWPAGATMPKVDPTDRFFAVQPNLMPNAEAGVGAGEATVGGFLSSDPVSVRFDVIEKYRPPQ